MCVFVIVSKQAVYARRQFKHKISVWESSLFPVVFHDHKDTYLFSIGAPQHIAAHDVDEVGLRVQLAHQPTEPPPEPGHAGEEERLKKCNNR